MNRPTRERGCGGDGRGMLLAGLSPPSSTEEAIDTAIASLLAARDQLGRT